MNWLIPTAHPTPVAPPAPPKRHVEVIKECRNCGKELVDLQRIWCSDKCRKTIWRKRPAPAKPTPLDLSGRCHWCGEKLPGEHTKRRKFCGYDCRKKHASLYQQKRK